MTNPRVAAAGVFCCLALAVLASPARAAEPSLDIRSATVASDGSVQAVVAVGGLRPGTTLARADLTVLDTGGRVEDLHVRPLTTMAVALLIDTSASTAGRPLASAIAAADRFVSSLAAGTTYSVITSGGTPRVVLPPTTDRGAVRTALRGLDAAGGAALYDALSLTAATLARTDGQRNAVVLSNGRDTASRSRMRDGVGALRAAQVGTTVIGLKTPDYNGNDGSISLARNSGGVLIAVTRQTGLAGALATVASTLSSQYEVRYTVTRSSASRFDLRVGLAGSGVTDAVTLLAPATALRLRPRPPLPSPQVDGGPLLAPFAEPIGLFVGLGAAFLAVVLMLAPVLLPAPDRGANRWLRRALQRPSSGRHVPDTLDGVITSALGRGVVDLVERHTTTNASIERLRAALARSGWPLRPAEFRVIQGAALVAGLVTGAGLLSRWWLGLALAAAGAALPQVVLRHRIASRSKAFLAQLPAALDILASSLQAGLSFLQALDGLVRELPDPAAAEFGRVVSESRLGMPVEDSLEAMAARIGAEDFTWVVMAITIQRRTGGNLAQLMRTVATTLRERDQVRAQIRVLSSEGRLSAVILIVLPFLLSAYIMVVNPGYIGKLFEVSIGRFMVGGALALMATGVLWMRRIIRIDI